MYIYLVSLYRIFNITLVRKLNMSNIAIKRSTFYDLFAFIRLIFTHPKHGPRSPRNIRRKQTSGGIIKSKRSPIL